MTTIELARQIAHDAHAGQTDKAGRPYIEHVGRVAAAQQSDIRQIIGWLHDVVEDTDVTLDAIRDDFGDDVAVAVDALTHRRDVARDDYIAGIASAGADAVHVKLADLRDNSAPARLALLDPTTRARLEATYRHDIGVLTAATGSTD